MLLYVLRPDLRDRVRGVRPRRRPRAAARVRPRRSSPPGPATSSRSAAYDWPRAAVVALVRAGAVDHRGRGLLGRRGRCAARSTCPMPSATSGRRTARCSAGSPARRCRPWPGARPRLGATAPADGAGSDRDPRARSARDRRGRRVRRPRPSCGASASVRCSACSWCGGRCAGPRPPVCCGRTSRTSRRSRTCA